MKEVMQRYNGPEEEDGPWAEGWETRASREALEEAWRDLHLRCSRSHPHELMSPACKLRVEIARLNNHAAHKDARIKKLEEELESKASG